MSSQVNKGYHKSPQVNIGQQRSIDVTTGHQKSRQVNRSHDRGQHSLEVTDDERPELPVVLEDLVDHARRPGHDGHEPDDVCRTSRRCPGSRGAAGNN